MGKPKLNLSQLKRRMETRTLHVGVIGLGFIGSTLAEALLLEGFSVKGYDIRGSAVDQAIERLEGQSQPGSGGSFQGSVHQKVLEGCEVILIAIRLALQDDQVSESALHRVSELVSGLERPPLLVAISSTIPPGATRRFADRLSSCVHLVAHAPERLSVGHGVSELKAIPHLVGGVDTDSTEAAETLLRCLCDQVVPVESCEISEFAKLTENAFMSVGIGLQEEVARAAHAVGISATDVAEACATKPFGYYPFRPTAGLGGHCLPNDLQMLRSAVSKLTGQSPLLEAVSAVTRNHPESVVERLRSLIEAQGGDLEGREVLLVGVGFKPGSSDTSATPATPIARALLAYTATPLFIDAEVSSFVVDDLELERIERDDLSSRQPLISMVLAGHSGLDLAELVKSSELVLDCSGGAFGRVEGIVRL